MLTASNSHVHVSAAKARLRRPMEELYWACGLSEDSETKLAGGKYIVVSAEPIVVGDVKLDARRGIDLLVTENTPAYFSRETFQQYGCEGVFTIPGVQLAEQNDLTATVYPLLSSGGNRVVFS